MMECLTCKKEFVPRRSWQRYCSPKCNNKARRWTADQQREWISGNWYRYFNRLVVSSSERKALTTNDLLELLEQQGGRCALTGAKLTNILVKGRKIWTNASIDRIVSGGPYIRGNIQLVCAAVNSFRSQMSIEEFKQWCTLVAKFRGLGNARLRKRVQNLPCKARAKEEPRPKKRGPARVDGAGKSAEGRRQGRRSQAPHSGRGKQLSVKSSRNFKK